MPRPKAPSETYGNLPHPASPGVFGALRDAVESVQRFAAGPRRAAHLGETAQETADRAVTGDTPEESRKRQHQIANE